MLRSLRLLRATARQSFVARSTSFFSRKPTAKTREPSFTMMHETGTRVAGGVNASASRSAPAGTHGGGRQSSKLRGELASAVRWAPRGAGRNSGLRGTPVADPRTSRSRTAGCGGIACFRASISSWNSPSFPPSGSGRVRHERSHAVGTNRSSKLVTRSRWKKVFSAWSCPTHAVR